MSDFKQALKYTLYNEGGFTNDAADSGGATNWGITHDDLARYRGVPVSTQDVRCMTEDEASLIYYKFYWTPLNLDKIKDDGIATAIFDIGVNKGIVKSAKFAQMVCMAMGHMIVIDGQLGPKSCEMINLCSIIGGHNDNHDFIDTFSLLVEASYINNAANVPSQIVFLKGWRARAKRLLELVNS